MIKNGKLWLAQKLGISCFIKLSAVVPVIKGTWNWLYTAECRYNAVQYNHILHKQLQELRQNMNQILNPHKNILYLTATGELWGVSGEYLWKKSPRYNITALYCLIDRVKSTSIRTIIQACLANIIWHEKTREMKMYWYINSLRPSDAYMHP